MQSGNNIHVQQHKTNMINEEWNETQNDAPFFAFYDMPAVTSTRRNGRCVDPGTAVVYSYTLIKPHRVSMALCIPVSEKKNFEIGFYVPTCGASFVPQRHYMNKLGRGPQGDAIYQISKV